MRCPWHRFCCIVFVEQRLALKIPGLDVIAVEDAQVSHAGARQQGSQGGADGAATDDGHAGRGQPALAFRADSAVQHLT